MPRLKQEDPITADNEATSEMALKMLGLLPGDYDLLSKDEKQKAKESRIRYLNRLTKAGYLNRFKTTGRGLKYYKTQLQRVYEEFRESGKSLIIN